MHFSLKFSKMKFLSVVVFLIFLFCSQCDAKLSRPTYGSQNPDNKLEQYMPQTLHRFKFLQAKGRPNQDPREVIEEGLLFERLLRFHLNASEELESAFDRRHPDLRRHLRDVSDIEFGFDHSKNDVEQTKHKNSKKYKLPLKQKRQYTKHFEVKNPMVPITDEKYSFINDEAKSKEIEKWSESIVPIHKPDSTVKQEKIPERVVKIKHTKKHPTKEEIGEKIKNLMRNKRAVVNSEYSGLGPHWGNPWWLGNTGEVALRVRPEGNEAVFRAEARATGYVGLAMGNDAVLAWLDDDEQPHILDCHLSNGVPMADYAQDYTLVFGLRNHTHLVIEFRRPLDTCDPDDAAIGSDPIDVQWALGQGDPRGSGWGGWVGSRSLQLLAPRPPPPPPPPPPTKGAPRVAGAPEDYERWDVMMKEVVIPEKMATTFWCRVFRAPELQGKRHAVGWMARAGPAARHMVLHECAAPPPQDLPSWERWSQDPAVYGPDIPRDWAVCLTPIAAWAIGSKGEMFPSHVGIPLGEPSGVTFYMLEIHYENPSLQRVIDSSGITVLHTDKLREHEAGIMVTGITVSALHVLPAAQNRYRSAGYCAEPCTAEMIPEHGINVVSVLLHAHGAGKKLALRHVRNDQELPKIAEDNNYDYKNQHSKILSEERNVQPGDALVTECTYDTSSRSKPTLGGYSAKQEMCLAFVLHYPRIPLAGCYSMTPVKEFFETFGVREFYNVDMKQVESVFLASGSLEGFPDLLDLTLDKSSKEGSMQGDDQGVSLLGQLVIKEPPEFRNKTFIAHLNEIPWTEPLLTKRVEDTLYKGKHMTFCRKRDDTIAVPIEISIFPKFSEIIEDPSKQCHYKSQHNGSTNSASSLIYNTYYTIFLLTVTVISIFIN